MSAVILLVQVVSTSQTPVKNDIPSIQVLVIQCMTGRTAVQSFLLCFGYGLYGFFSFLFIPFFDKITFSRNL